MTDAFIKSIVVLFVLSICAAAGPDTAPDDPNEGMPVFGYEFQGNDLHRIGFNFFSKRIDGRYMFEFPLGIAFINDDPWNGNRFNVSVMWLAHSLVVNSIPDVPANKFENNPFANLRMAVLSLINGKHHLVLGRRRDNEQGRIDAMLSIFVKNQVEVFPFRKTIWTSFSPGAGIMTAASVFAVELGMNLNVFTDFTDWQSDPAVYLLLGVDVMKLW